MDGYFVEKLFNLL